MLFEEETGNIYKLGNIEFFIYCYTTQAKYLTFSACMNGAVTDLPGTLMGPCNVMSVE